MNRMYSVRFVALMRVFPDLFLIFKHFSNALFISGVEEKRRRFEGIISLNIKLNESWIIN